MNTSLHDYLNIIILYFPLGVVGMWRWSTWIVKKIVARHYRPIHANSYRNSLSIVIPVYNETPDIFQKALESWAENGPDEIIAVIDHTDAACIRKFEEFAKKHENSRLIVTPKPGKRAALADGIKTARCNIIALVDSDTIWDPDIKNILLYPFNDPEVGGVVPRQDVLDTNTLARRLFNIHLDQRYFDELTYLAVVADALTCLSGRTAIYRKEAVKGICDKLESETFWGARCISGDDKCITRLVQENGWKVRYQANARVLTPGAADLASLFKQHVRWTRNTYRSDIKSLASAWIWKREKFLAFHMIDRFTQPYTLVLSPIYFALSIVWGHWLVAGILLAWWHFSRGIKLHAHLRHRPSDILILPFYVFTNYLMAVLKIYAMVTIGRQGWITRWDKNRLRGMDAIFLKTFKASAPYLATVSILLGLSFGLVKYKSAVITPGVAAVSVAAGAGEGGGIDACGNAIASDAANGRFAHYIVEKGDTLSFIAKRYNSDFNAVSRANEDSLSDEDNLKIGQQLKLPVEELRSALGKKSLIGLRDAKITFNEPDAAIHIEGGGSAATLPEIHAALHDDTLLERLSDKEWLLKADILVKRGATLVIDGGDAELLKLKSDADAFVRIESDGGNILINETKITSWDESRQAPDIAPEDGRSFIVAKQNGRMDIVNSELSFLGYASGIASGIAWHAFGANPNAYLLAGTAWGSAFHDNYSGIYLSSVSAMLIAHSNIADNARFGIDIRNAAGSIFLEQNWIHGNRKNDYHCQ